jgi:hypothetical protein
LRRLDVIPAEAGIHAFFFVFRKEEDSRLRGNDAAAGRGAGVMMSGRPCRSLLRRLDVIPAEAGIHAFFFVFRKEEDSRLRGNDAEAGRGAGVMMSGRPCRSLLRRLDVIPAEAGIHAFFFVFRKEDGFPPSRE